MSKLNVLVLGTSGMLGHAVFRSFSEDAGYSTWGSVRNSACVRFFPAELKERIVSGFDVLCSDSLVRLLSEVRPNIVINCVGLIKQLEAAKDPTVALPINSLFPIRLARLCRLIDARLIHVSTDCVFSGRDGGYTELSKPDADDLYGRSKLLGEISDLDNVITLRTSIIGHELDSSHALIDWFLSQEGSVRGYAKATFSGLPTVELARVMRDYVAPAPELSGLYHVSADPIDKFTLLNLVAKVYGKEIEIKRDDTVRIDRSLNSTRFKVATGYAAPAWPELIARMHKGR